MAKEEAESQFSAGGLAIDCGKVLMIRTNNLEGREVWTFPKGHIEKNETPEEAAVREVAEETGYKCRILKSLPGTQYAFREGSKTVNKTVKWFLMEPVSHSNEHDAIITKVSWLPIARAKKTLSYPLDRRLLTEVWSLMSDD